MADTAEIVRTLRIDAGVSLLEEPIWCPLHLCSRHDFARACHWHRPSYSYVLHTVPIHQVYLKSGRTDGALPDRSGTHSRGFCWSSTSGSMMQG